MTDTITKTDKIKVHYFREFAEGYCEDMICNGNNHIPRHGNLPGMHGKDKKYCKACVIAVLAVINKGEHVYVGIAFRNPKDQFNSKIGRAIAIGRAEKNVRLGIDVDAFTLVNDIKYCYDRPTEYIKGYLRHYLPKKD